MGAWRAVVSQGSSGQWPLEWVHVAVGPFVCSLQWGFSHGTKAKAKDGNPQATGKTPRGPWIGWGGHVAQVESSR